MKASTYTTYAVYTPNIDRIEVPQIRDQQVWEAFYKKLLTLDYTAPFHVVLAKYRVFADVDFTVPPSVYSGLYYDLGIDMASDDLYHSEDAALSTGFFQKGVRMIAAAVIADAGHDRNLLTAAEQVFKDKSLWQLLSEDLVEVLKSYLEEDEDEANEVIPVSVPDEVPVDPFAEIPVEESWNNEEDQDFCSVREILAMASDAVPAEIPASDSEDKDVDHMTYWIKRFEDEMMADTNAAGSILSYYLKSLLGQSCTVFCPRGYTPYAEIGDEMSSSKTILKAAEKAGLLAEGVARFVAVALSNEDCWYRMDVGVSYLINDPNLRRFIPFRDRYIAENMLYWQDNMDVVGVEWEDIYNLYRNKLGREMRGY